MALMPSTAAITITQHEQVKRKARTAIAYADDHRNDLPTRDSRDKKEHGRNATNVVHVVACRRENRENGTSSALGHPPVIIIEGSRNFLGNCASIETIERVPFTGFDAPHFMAHATWFPRYPSRKQHA